MKIEQSAVAFQSERSYCVSTKNESSVSVYSGGLSLPGRYGIGSAEALEGHSENYSALGSRGGRYGTGNGLVSLRRNQSALGTMQAVRSDNATETGKKKTKSMAQIRMEFLARLLDRIAEIKSRRDSLGSGGAAAAGASYAGAGGQLVESTVNGWTYVSYSSSTFTETETTAFSSAGTVKTADGQEISFDISIEMSRSFTEKYESVMVQTVACTDPLVINYDGDMAQVSDMKFFFDLDCDGEEEEISCLKRGSGFLALDKNGDGTINDGSELFGARSGDGFAELADYDEDGNGWIDESDSIFKELRIWIRNEYGQNVLVPLSRAGVGAICLDSKETQFSLNSMEDNRTNAYIRKTGIFLMENGSVGTVQHVDFAGGNHEL